MSSTTHKTYKLLEDVAIKSESGYGHSPLTCRWYKRECSEVDQETVVSAWASLGNYIARNLRQGRAVAVPKLGLFTFTPPEVDLAVRSQALFGREPRTIMSEKRIGGSSSSSSLTTLHLSVPLQ